MGSSYRMALKSGSAKEWEIKLRESIKLIKEVIPEIKEGIHSDGQWDNTADDGGLLEILYLVIELIERELPSIKN